MDDNNRKHALNAQVERILGELFEVTAVAIGRQVSDEAAAWWRTHYGAKFYYAIDFKARSLERDTPFLRHQARRLGEIALAMAKGRSVITREHAALASFVLDCPPQSESDVTSRETWCS